MDPAPTRSPSGAAPALLVAGIVVVALVLGGIAALAAGGLDQPSPQRQPPAERALVAPRPEIRASALLSAWDRRRAEAWARVDPDLLTTLYTHRSSAGEHDRTMLESWRSRGLRVEGLRSQLVEVRVLGHRPGRFDLVVTDRVVAGTVVGPGTSRALPHDGPTTAYVVLVRTEAGWVVESVRGVGISAGADPWPAPR